MVSKKLLMCTLLATSTLGSFCMEEKSDIKQLQAELYEKQLELLELCEKIQAQKTILSDVNERLQDICTKITASKNKEKTLLGLTENQREIISAFGLIALGFIAFAMLPKKMQDSISSIVDSTPFQIAWLSCFLLMSYEQNRIEKETKEKKAVDQASSLTAS